MLEKYMNSSTMLFTFIMYIRKYLLFTLPSLIHVDLEINITVFHGESIHRLRRRSAAMEVVLQRELKHDQAGPAHGQVSNFPLTLKLYADFVYREKLFIKIVSFFNIAILICYSMLYV